MITVKFEFYVERKAKFKNLNNAWIRVWHATNYLQTIPRCARVINNLIAYRKNLLSESVPFKHSSSSLNLVIQTILKNLRFSGTRSVDTVDTVTFCACVKNFRNTLNKVYYKIKPSDAILFIENVPSKLGRLKKVAPILNNLKLAICQTMRTVCTCYM